MNITILGLDELNRKLNRIQGDLRPSLEQATNKAVLYVHSTVPPYPAPPAASTYRRTGTMGRSITTEVRSLGSQVVGVIGTNVIYAPWVISDESAGGAGPQAFMHKGRWWTLQGVVSKARDNIVKIYEDAVRALLR